MPESIICDTTFIYVHRQDVSFKHVMLCSRRQHSSTNSTDYSSSASIKSWLAEGMTTISAS